MRSRQLSTSLAAMALLNTVLMAASASAQDAKQGGGGLQIAQASGTMQAMALNQIKILGEDKKETFIVLTEQTSLQYRGTAEADFLTPGLLVRFTTELNQSGLAQSPVSELEVFTYSQNRRMTPDQVREQTAGVYQIGNEAPNEKKPNTKESPKKSSSKHNAASSGSQAYRVVGQVVGAQSGKFFVQAGAVRVQFELDPKAVINVTSRDTTFMQMDDKVKVSGLRNAAQEQYIQAESVEIVGAKPLGPAEGKAGAKSSKNAKAKSKGGKTSASKDTDDDKNSDAKKTDSGKPGTKPDSKKPAPK